MPVKVEALITAETDTSNSVSGVVANLATLLEADEDVDVACLCNDSVRQIYRVEGEGNHFCGYRNMQMLLSVLTSSGDVPSTISDKILERRPTIPELQTAIEAAWDAGYNSHGKVLTGGIQGTRKHVGTPEVCRPGCRPYSKHAKGSVGGSSNPQSRFTVHWSRIPRQRSLD